MKKTKYTELRGILTGVPEGTTLPAGKYIYQKTKPGLGNIPGDKTRRLQVRRWTVQNNPRTAAQREARMAFRLGVAAWKKKSESEKEVWRAPGLALSLNRFQAFMRDWMKTYWSEKMAILLDAGQYIPATTTVENCSSPGDLPATFSRVGDVVTVSHIARIIPTAVGANVIYEIPLPIPTTMDATSDLNGAGQTNVMPREPVVVGPNVAAGTARCTFTPSTTNEHRPRIVFQYIIK